MNFWVSTQSRKWLSNIDFWWTLSPTGPEYSFETGYATITIFTSAVVYLRQQSKLMKSYTVMVFKNTFMYKIRDSEQLDSGFNMLWLFFFLF